MKQKHEKQRVRKRGLCGREESQQQRRALEMYSFHINVNCKCYLKNLLNCEKNIIIITITMISKGIRECSATPRKVKGIRR